MSRWSPFTRCPTWSARPNGSMDRQPRSRPLGPRRASSPASRSWSHRTRGQWGFAPPRSPGRWCGAGDPGRPRRAPGPWIIRRHDRRRARWRRPCRDSRRRRRRVRPWHRRKPPGWRSWRPPRRPGHVLGGRPARGSCFRRSTSSRMIVRGHLDVLGSVANPKGSRAEALALPASGTIGRGQSLPPTTSP